MKETLAQLKNKLTELRQWDGTYRALRRHLNTMPVGFPATLSGVERRLLKAMFTVDEAKVALHMDYRFESADMIFAKAKSSSISKEALEARLAAMENRGAIFAKEEAGVMHYALVPFVIGMYEMQVARMSPGYYLDTREYVTKAFGIEYLTTAVPQMRVVPVAKSVTPEHNIATYDEIRTIIEQTEKRIGVAECICRKAKDLLGEPCERTDRREVCLGFRDFHDMYGRHGWGRTITKEEALAILDRSEKEGLVLQPSNEQEPQFVCACCGCCCGVLEMMRIMPRPADFAASNFYAVLDFDTCNGCGVCVRRCQMGALQIKNKKAVLDTGKCIGCGLCVTTCKTKSLRLEKKSRETVPPKTTEDLYDTIMAGKKGLAGKLLKAARGAMGLRV
ncbi:MAG: 4Fe-4S binding protein [Thermodesulfobacteriota bacterium]